MIPHLENHPSGLGSVNLQRIEPVAELWPPCYLARYDKPFAIYALDPAIEVKEGIFGPRYSLRPCPGYHRAHRNSRKHECIRSRSSNMNQVLIAFSNSLLSSLPSFRTR